MNMLVKCVQVILVMGPLLARLGHAIVALPDGLCN